MLVLTNEQLRQIQAEGVAAYPNECCGAMLGHDEKGADHVRRRVVSLEPLKNAFSESERYHRFSLDPLELMRLEKNASERKMAVLGFYHSHPDAPARPSEYDRSHAWPFYSYVIVSIAKGRSVDLTSWQLNEQTEQFETEEILNEG